MLEVVKKLVERLLEVHKHKKLVVKIKRGRNFENAAILRIDEIVDVTNTAFLRLEDGTSISFLDDKLTIICKDKVECDLSNIIDVTVTRENKLSVRGTSFGYLISLTIETE